MASPSSVVRFAMMRPGLKALGFIPFVAAVAFAADATTPVDYTQRNAPFAPAAPTAVAPEKQKPAANSAVQEKRFETPTIERKLAPQAGQRAAIDVTESREKAVKPKVTQRPDVREQPTSAFNHRPAAITTAADTTKPPTVARYQDSLTAASATNMARFPALDRATTAKINRFVFRKNPPDPSVVPEGKSITPAAGGGVPGK